MNSVPRITVQLVHIEGPLKGRIQELSDDKIVIGRHPECQVRYPRDLVILSRRHARIVREGNRFKLVDQSTNGTYVNGQPASQTYLKSGDVITFADSGPKVSFLTQVGDGSTFQAPPESPARVSPATPPQAAAPPRAPAAPPRTPSPPQTPSPPPDPEVQNAQVPFVIQYGPALKSFQALPITLGKGAGCHFLIDHGSLSDQQAQIFFAHDQYWIKDLTGNNMIQINGLPIVGQSALQPDMQIALSPKGPNFRFLGGGRLVEVEEAAQAPPDGDAAPAPDASGKARASGPAGAKSGGFFKKFFR